MCNASANIQELTSLVREKALQLGFLKVGIAPAHPLAKGRYLETWLQQGFQGEMRYMERQVFKRLDPKMLLANAKSLIVLALNYYTGDPVINTPEKGRISRYAWGTDYHSIVKNRLELLYRFVKGLEPSSKGLCCVDTGPVMEKAWGSQTSLGWTGKNTNLISKSCGSWFFLGVILFDIELEYDSPEPDRCGSCISCMDACPTGAIVSPYVLDARRCISYLTIEHRGPIPRQLRSLIGNRIFGCDDCQESCPWNRFAPRTIDKEFLSKEWTPTLDLIPLTNISDCEFRQRFSRSPIWRATRDGFVRNVVVALGNSGSENAIQPLSEALQDTSPLVRSHAAWALGRFELARVSGILESARSKEKAPEVMEEIRIALERN